MEQAPQYEQAKPEFAYDNIRAEASVRIPGKGGYRLENVELTEPTKELSILTGRDRETDATVVMEILDDVNTLALTKVTVDGEIVYQPTQH